MDTIGAIFKIQEFSDPLFTSYITLQINAFSRQLMTDREIDEQIEQYAQQLKQLSKDAKKALKKLKQKK
jgi:single-stranded DNA-specific DHH superfamily exonuclease